MRLFCLADTERLRATNSNRYEEILISADYWKSQGRKFCDFCKCWIADNKPSIEFHEGGKKHKENVAKRLKEIHKTSAKQAKQTRKFEDDIKKMENAAMAAYLKDIESNKGDIMAEEIIRDKLNKIEKAEPTPNPNEMPAAADVTNPRYSRSKRDRDHPADMDYCDPYRNAKRKEQIRGGPQAMPMTSGIENKTQGKSSKGGREKRKGAKRPLDEDRPNKPCTQKLWYEARSPEGYTYYWHIETNESVWEAPIEGFMTIAEQEEEAKEHAIQAEFFEQIEKEEAKEKAEIMEEQRANYEREKLRELRKKRGERRKHEDAVTESQTESTQRANEENGKKNDSESEEEEKIPYRRDYSVPEKPDPYGPWQTVQVIHKKPVDLQLPKKKETMLIPTVQSVDNPPSKRIFVEKTVTKLSTGDSDDERAPTTFKKRKFGAKNVRKRFDDD